MSLLQTPLKAFLPLEKQCCTIEQAEKLYELGVEQNSTFYYCPNPNGEQLNPISNLLGNFIVDGNTFVFSGENIRFNAVEGNYENTYSAFNSTELGEILSWFDFDAFGFSVFMTFCHEKDSVYGKNRWDCAFRNASKFSNPDIHKPTEAQARAEMLIFLLENKHWDVNEINSKINP